MFISPIRMCDEHQSRRVAGRLRRDGTLPREMRVVRVRTACHLLEIVVRELVWIGAHRPAYFGKHDERIDVRVTLDETNAKVRWQANAEPFEDRISRFVEKPYAKRDVGSRSGEDGIQRGTLVLGESRHV
jgi:hypothetical protein